MAGGSKDLALQILLRETARLDGRPSRRALFFCRRPPRPRATQECCVCNGCQPRHPNFLEGNRECPQTKSVLADQPPGLSAVGHTEADDRATG